MACSENRPLAVKDTVKLHWDPVGTLKHEIQISSFFFITAQ